MKIDTLTNEVNYPSNSRNSKITKQDQRPKVTKITKGAVVKRKKSLGSRFMETFVGESVDNVMSYVIHDVLVPAAKSMFEESINRGLEMMLHGQTRGNNTVRDKGKSYVSYNSYSNQRTSNNSNRQTSREIPARSRHLHSFDDIVLNTRGEAEEVLSHLVDLTIDYDRASVSDLYDLVGVTGEFTDNKYGWTNLESASVSRTRDGYLLNMPKVIILD